MIEISKYLDIRKVIKQNPATVKLIRESFIKPYNIDTSKYSWHHILPVQCGGQNNRGNLVVMEKKQHDALHRNYINPQIEGMRVGEDRIILLPTNYDMKSYEFKMFHKLYMEAMLKDFARKRQKVRER